MTQDHTVKLRATLLASPRTRDRIRKNGPTFTNITPRSNPKPGFTLYKSMRTDWKGWLPVGEFQEV